MTTAKDVYLEELETGIPVSLGAVSGELYVEKVGQETYEVFFVETGQRARHSLALFTEEDLGGAEGRAGGSRRVHYHTGAACKPIGQPCNANDCRGGRTQVCRPAMGPYQYCVDGA